MGGSASRFWSMRAIATLVPMRTSPASGASAPVRRLISVVLPAPLAPITPIRSPRMMRVEKFLTIGVSVVGLADRLGLDHQRPGGLGVLGDHGRNADRPARLAPLAAHVGELADAAHVALAPRRHAVAHPVLLGDDLAVELVALGLLLLELGVAPGLEGGKAAIEAMRRAAVDPDGGVGQVRHQPPVVADEGQRRAARQEMAFQPLDRDEVEVVGRLVEQQDVRLGAEHPDQRRAPRLAS